MFIQTFTNSLCGMILYWYSHNISGIYVYYCDYKSFCFIVIWKGAHYVCDGSSVQAVREDHALSQEDGSPTAAVQVGKKSDSYNWNISREIPARFKSAIGYQANHSYLNSFQTSSGSSPKLVALVRTIQVKERPTSKYQPPYVFKPKEFIPTKRLLSRPNRFKLAYVGNSKDKDREGSGMKFDT